MANGTRVRLDEGKKREIIAILSVGGSRRTAATYVGCAVSTIRSTAKRDPRFADALYHAECQSEISNLKTLHNASWDGRQWRAAAWALERKNPQDFAHRNPETITATQLQDLFAQLTQMIVEEIPVAAYRKIVAKRMNALLGNFLRTVWAKERPKPSEGPTKQDPSSEARPAHPSEEKKTQP